MQHGFPLVAFDVSLFLSCPIGDELLRPAAVQPGTPTPPLQDWESHRDRQKETQMEKEKQKKITFERDEEKRRLRRH
jgi:hypothetical protein